MDQDQLEAVAQLTNAIANDPRTRKEYFKLVKVVAPKQPIPEIDEPIRFETEVIAPLRKENLELRARLDRMELGQQVNQVWADTLKATGLRMDEIPEVKKIMEEKLIGSPQTAAEFYMQGRRLATPRAGGRGPLELPWRAGIDRFKGLFQNPIAWSRKEAHEAVRDIEIARDRG